MPENNGLLTYSSNNSGGTWWLKRADWLKLEEAAWIVHWVHDVKQVHPDHEIDPSNKNDPHNFDGFGGHTHHYGLPLLPANPEGDWLGAGATSASKRFVTPEDGVEEWEHLTGQRSTDAGCPSCGAPHYFDWEPDDGKYRKNFSIDYDWTEDHDSE